MVVDRGYVAPSALQRMAMLQAPASGGVEDQVDRRLASFAMNDWVRLLRSRIAIDDLPSCRTSSSAASTRAAPPAGRRRCAPPPRRRASG